MKHLLNFTLASLLSLWLLQGSAQIAWTWTELPSMPFRTGNNAVVEAEVSGVKHVYSFGGIDTTKVYSGIHQKCFRYNTATMIWDTIPDLPDTLGKIASGASVVNNIIYIMGGYHVYANGDEASSDRVHRYDPQANTYLSDGAPIPVPIDDQVQCVWRDSLIYLITGWSNTANQPDVQIYDPANDSWQAGTSTPFNNQYVAFGASGMVINDTIFYNGGAAGMFTFTNRPYLRKGIINPNDPTDITWTQESDNPGDAGYRMAAASYGSRIFWVGGSGKAYNYNGIAYDGTGGVSPLYRILHLDTDFEDWNEGLGAPYGVMDLRGIAQITSTRWVICGGMMDNQWVSDRAFQLDYDPIIGSVSDRVSKGLKIYPNPATDRLFVQDMEKAEQVVVYSLEGVVTLKLNKPGRNYLRLGNFSAGTYIIQMNTVQGSAMGTFSVAP